VGIFGFVFGGLAVQVGFSPWLAVAASLLIVSGAAQLALVGLIASGPGAVLIATTGLALRHIPMSATLSELIGPVSRWRRFHLAWILVDETFGLSVHAAGKGEPDLAAYKTGSDLTLYSTWLVSTLAGALLGTQVDPERLGLSIIFPLVFLGLALPLLKSRRQWVTAGLAVGATVAAVVFLPPAWQISSAALAAAVIGSRLR
jgi:predicted branched-subunit amino acid permease